MRGWYVVMLATVLMSLWPLKMPKLFHLSLRRRLMIQMIQLAQVTEMIEMIKMI